MTYQQRKLGRSLQPFTLFHRGIRSWVMSAVVMVAFFVISVPQQVIAQTAESDAQFTVQTRIIGGTKTAESEFPWMAALVYNNSWPLADRQFCGASVIDSQWILTAAHCLYDSRNRVLESSKFSVALGVTDLENDEPSAITEVTNIIIHPSYDHLASNPINDVALLELAQATTITPVPLFKQASTQLTGDSATVIGWGATDYSDPGNPVYPVDLYKVDLPIVSLSVCNSPISYGGVLIESQLCAGYANGGKDSCTGDSGGPLVVFKDGRQQQVGLVSFGNGCAEANYYGVYTNIPSFIDWINDYAPVGESEPSSGTDVPEQEESIETGSGTPLSLLTLFAVLLFRRRKLC